MHPKLTKPEKNYTAKVKIALERKKEQKKLTKALKRDRYDKTIGIPKKSKKS